MMGPYNCLGKGLAMMELQTVIGWTIYKYNIHLAEPPFFDEGLFFDGFKDHFTAGILGCQLIFEKRGRS
jgi:cytochrome P450